MEHIFGINNSSPRLLPCDTSMSQSPHAALSHYQCGDNYPPKMRTNWLFIKGRASFSLRPLVPGMRRSSVAVLVLLPLATTTLPLNPDHNDSTPHPLIPPRMRKGYSTFRVRPRILKGLFESVTELKLKFLPVNSITKLQKAHIDLWISYHKQLLNIARLWQETAREDKKNPLQLGILSQDGADQCWPPNEGICQTYSQKANWQKLGE